MADLSSRCAFITPAEGSEDIGDSASVTPMYRAMTRANTIFDSGWLYVISGLGMLAAVILVPAADDLNALKEQEAQLKARLDLQNTRLARYSQFKAAIDRKDPVVVRRLVAAQLNLGDPKRTPVLVRLTPNRGNVFSWIEPHEAGKDMVRPTESLLAQSDDDSTPTSVQVVSHTYHYPAKERQTLLRKLLSKQGIRPWLLAGSAFCLFIGLLPPVRNTAKK